jgi:hypothetical protein
MHTLHKYMTHRYKYTHTQLYALTAHTSQHLHLHPHRVPRSSAKQAIPCNFITLFHYPTSLPYFITLSTAVRHLSMS